MKKLFALLFLSLFVFSLSVPAFAAESTNVGIDSGEAMLGYGEASTRAINPPTESKTLPYDAQIINLLEGSYTYSAKKFKPTGTDIQMKGTLKACNEELDKFRMCTVELYKSGGGNPVKVYSTGAFTTSKEVDTTFDNLDSNTYYYVIIRNSINDAADGQRAIEGTLTFK